MGVHRSFQVCPGLRCPYRGQEELGPNCLRRPASRRRARHTPDMCGDPTVDIYSRDVVQASQDLQVCTEDLWQVGVMELGKKYA